MERVPRPDLGGLSYVLLRVGSRFGGTRRRGHYGRVMAGQGGTDRESRPPETRPGAWLRDSPSFRQGDRLRSKNSRTRAFLRLRMRRCSAAAPCWRTAAGFVTRHLVWLRRRGNGHSTFGERRICGTPLGNRSCKRSGFSQIDVGADARVSRDRTEGGKVDFDRLKLAFGQAVDAALPLRVCRL